MNVGLNIRLSELQALMIYSVVKEYEQIIKNKLEIAKKYSDICKNLNIQYISQKNNLTSGNYYTFTLISPNEDISKLLPKVKTTTSKIYDYALGNSKQIPLKHLCLPIWFGLEESVSDKVVSELKSSKEA